MAAHDIEFVTQSPTIDVFVGHIGPAIDDALAINFDNVRIIERGRGDAFTFKTLDVFRIVHHVDAHHLDGDAAARNDVIGLINISHPAMGNPRGDPIAVVDFLSDLNHVRSPNS